MSATSSADPKATGQGGDGTTKWASNDGSFRRQVSSFRDVISPSHVRDAKFPAQVGRYHLIVSYACPWAHRTLILRQLKGIDRVPDLLPVHAVDSFLGPQGWSFEPYPDDVTGGVKSEPGSGNKIPGHEAKRRLREFYQAAQPGYEARCTVPVVWDNEQGTIVSNESSEIIRFLNNSFDEFVADQYKGVDFYPAAMRKDIDELNAWVYDTVNNGVYKSGFATTQQAYEAAVRPLFESLDRLEKILSDGREFLFGNSLTEADIRLYTTIIRFDTVYQHHFKCNFRSIRQGYPHLHTWLRRLYWKNPAFRETTSHEAIKKHYYQSHSQINPTRITPVGPVPEVLPLYD